MLSLKDGACCQAAHIKSGGQEDGRPYLLQMFLQMSLSRGHSCYLLAPQNLPNAKFSICARVTDPAIKILTMCANYLSQSEKGSIKKAHL